MPFGPPAVRHYFWNQTNNKTGNHQRCAMGMAIIVAVESE
jgi:hypothetical protein